jgi:hypothetical protein
MALLVFNDVRLTSLPIPLNRSSAFTSHNFMASPLIDMLTRARVYLEKLSVADSKIQRLLWNSTAHHLHTTGPYYIPTLTLFFQFISPIPVYSTNIVCIITHRRRATCSAHPIPLHSIAQLIFHQEHSLRRPELPSVPCPLRSHHSSPTRSPGCIVLYNNTATGQRSACV